jgi:hypothetical protein
MTKVLKTCRRLDSQSYFERVMELGGVPMPNGAEQTGGGTKIRQI